MPHFPATSYWKILETDEAWSGGGFQVQRHEQIKKVRLRLYKHGASANTEKLKAGIYHDALLTRPVAESSWSYLRDITIAGDYVRTWFRFDFADQWLIAGQTYFIGVTASGYTRNALAHYLALRFLGDSVEMDIFSDRKVSYL